MKNKILAKRRENSTPRNQMVGRGKAEQTKELEQNETPEDAARHQFTDRLEEEESKRTQADKVQVVERNAKEEAAHANQPRII
jgi:hypothetical protein